VEPGAPGVQRKFLERNGERAVVERRSGLPYFVGVGCVFGRDQRLITRRRIPCSCCRCLVGRRRERPPLGGPGTLGALAWCLRV